MAAQDVDRQRRRMLVAATTAVGGVGVGLAAVPFIASFQPSARARAVGAPIEIDIARLQPGQLVRAKWRGRPTWVVRRTPEMIEELPKHDDMLRDPLSEKSRQPPYCKNELRSLRPEFFVVIGVCTHLGCSPNYVPLDSPEAESLGADWPGGFFCPCHGSRFDLAGRVFKGVPAPTNLEVPPYRYVTDTLVRIGEDAGRA